jgi:hypothetical protein
MKNRRIVIDDSPVTLDMSDTEDIREIVGEIVNRCLPFDRVIEEIFLDGAPIYQDGHFLEDAPTSKGEEIRVRTGNLDEFLRESSLTLISHLTSVTSLFSEIGRNLRKGNVDVVFRGEGPYRDKGGPYVQGIEALVTAQVLVDQIRSIQKTHPHLLSESPLVLVPDENRFEELLKGMLSAQETQDWILLADLVEYELTPIFEKGLVSAEAFHHSIAVTA